MSTAQVEEIRYKPRKDRVLIKKVVVDKWGQIAVSQRSLEGQRYIVEAIGADVKELEIGQEVLIGGKENLDWAHLPGRSDLVITSEANVFLVIERRMVDASSIKLADLNEELKDLYQEEEDNND